MNRLENLDWLRGLLALSIMAYHLTGWKLFQPDAGGLLGRLGVYGVSMFFVLSGLAMAAGYNGFIRDGRSALQFFVRRIFRIWPLLWLAVAAVTLGGVAFKGQAVDWPLVVLNITTLFGFVSPGEYINTGAWSIGNEMVYYALTPPLLAAYDRSARIGNLLAAATVAIGAYFAFVAISPEATLASQWSTYIHPLNNLFLYCTGVALFYNGHLLVLRTPATLVLMLLCVAVLALYPLQGDLVVTVTGVGRCVMVAASVGLVFAFYKLTARPARWISGPLTALGVATYGVYLLHPIVFQAVELILRRPGSPPPWTSMALTSIATICVSLLVYRFFEAPMIRLGKRLTQRATVMPGTVAPAGGAGPN